MGILFIVPFIIEKQGFGSWKGVAPVESLYIPITFEITAGISAMFISEIKFIGRKQNIKITCYLSILSLCLALFMGHDYIVDTTSLSRFWLTI